jgi:NADH dehydrogenase
MGKKVVIVGAGFAGLNCAKKLAGKDDLRVDIIDRRNYHLFQPLLYQVAMAGLSPAEIAVPIRTLLARHRNVEIKLDNVTGADLGRKKVFLSGNEGKPVELDYDYLVLACGAKHSYFAHPEWENDAPGLKTLEQATEIRRRVLLAFELAEKTSDPEEQKRLLTFVVVGGGPTGVELAGALGEISRYTLSRDFRHIDPARTRVILIEAGPRILAAFDPELSKKAARDLEELGVQTWTQSRVTDVNADGVRLGNETVRAATVLWAAGVQPSSLGRSIGLPLDTIGRVKVGEDLSVAGHPEVFVLGDMANAPGPNGQPVPGLAPAAMQEGRATAENILADLKGKPRKPFRYLDKGMMATIGRKKAVGQFKSVRFTGFIAWMAWLFVHVYYLIGFKNRLFVLAQWAYAYVSFRRGARLIVDKEWRSQPKAIEARPSAHLKNAALGLLLPLFALLASGCATLKERAQEQLLKENYAEAADLYERSLLKEPGDPEAIDGLRRARRGWLDQELIKVRKARLGGDPEGALELLISVFDRQRSWKEYAGAQVAFTQNEELDFAYPSYRTRILKSVKEGHPLVAEQTRNRYAALFAQPERARDNSALDSEVRSRGQSECRKMAAAASSRTPYFIEFVARYCAHFGDTSATESLPSSDTKFGELYRDVRFEGKVEGLAPDRQADLEQKLRAAFSQSLWHHSKGKQIARFALQGQFKSEHTKDIENRVHNYDADEPYETWETVAKTRSVPYTVLERRPLAPNSNQYQDVSVTRYRDETYYERDRVIRYRRVSRAHPYNAVRHRQALDFSVSAKGELGGKEVTLAHGSEEKREGYEHSLSIPQIGLNPETPNLAEPGAWLQQQFQPTAAQLLTQARAIWSSHACSEPDRPGFATLGDAVQRCIAGQIEPAPAFVNTWYLQNLGISRADAEAVLTRKQP